MTAINPPRCRRVRHQQLQRHADRDRRSSSPRSCLRPAFAAAAHKLGQPVTVQPPTAAAPGPDRRTSDGLSAAAADRRYLAAILVKRPADRGGAVACAHPDRLFIIGVLTDLIVAADRPYFGSHFWRCCRVALSAAVVLAAAAIQGLAGKRAPCWWRCCSSSSAAPARAGSGPTCCRVLAQHRRAVPAANAVDLIRNVIYFGGNDITTPLIVLFLYALARVAVISYLNWNPRARAGRAAAAARARGDLAGATSPGTHRRPRAGHDAAGRSWPRC